MTTVTAAGRIDVISDAICPWCVSSAVIMTLLAIVTTVRLLRAPNDHRGAIPYVG